MDITICLVPSSLSVEAYERRIQRLEREKTELVRKLQGVLDYWIVVIGLLIIGLNQRLKAVTSGGVVRSYLQPNSESYVESLTQFKQGQKDHNISSVLHNFHL